MIISYMFSLYKQCSFNVLVSIYKKESVALEKKVIKSTSFTLNILVQGRSQWPHFYTSYILLHNILCLIDGAVENINILSLV